MLDRERKGAAGGKKGKRFGGQTEKSSMVSSRGGKQEELAKKRWGGWDSEVRWAGTVARLSKATEQGHYWQGRENSGVGLERKKK